MLRWKWGHQWLACNFLEIPIIMPTTILCLSTGNHIFMRLEMHGSISKKTVTKVQIVNTWKVLRNTLRRWWFSSATVRSLDCHLYVLASSISLYVSLWLDFYLSTWEDIFKKEKMVWSSQHFRRAGQNIYDQWIKCQWAANERALEITIALLTTHLLRPMVCSACKKHIFQTLWVVHCHDLIKVIMNTTVLQCWHCSSPGEMDWT